MGQSERQRAWTRYWQSGALHSCVGSYDGNYGGAVAAYWRPRFERLEPGHRVLDLCTGNGPLPALIVDMLPTDRVPHIDAVDYAHPQPAWLAQLPPTLRARIHFHEGVDIGTLPFADAAFDQIVSQYGFEYAARDAAQAELLRVLKPAGGVALVCHHADSWLVRVADDEVAHIDWLLNDGVIDAVREILPHLQGAGETAAAIAARTRFNDTMDALVARTRTARIPDALHDAADTLGQLIQWTTERGAGAGAQALKHWTDALRDARLRSDELRSHALSERDAQALASALRAELAELHEGDYLIGWTITR